MHFKLHKIRDEAPIEDYGPLGTLYPPEVPWRERFEILKASGYLLRPRYRPGWKPSWKPGRAPLLEEDCFLQERHSILDATRMKDGLVVILKHIRKDSAEVSIGEYLSSEALRGDPRNHCVPILEILELPDDSDHVIIVMPLLRRIDHPDPSTVRECLEFVEQALEGLAFMHEHQVAHRDCGFYNILMDARPMYRRGWHPSEYNSLPNGKLIPRFFRRSRSAAGGVRYYWIDFGLSSRGQDLVTGSYGQDRTPPELSDTVPYNPYKLDVFVLGKVFNKFLMEKRTHIDFLLPLVTCMTRADPSERPTSAESLAKYYEIRRGLKLRAVYCRSLSKTVPQPEGPFLGRIKDAYYLYCELFWLVKFFVAKRGSAGSFPAGSIANRSVEIAKDAPAPPV